MAGEHLLVIPNITLSDYLLIFPRSLAVHFHNGTTRFLASVSPTHEYLALLRLWEREPDGENLDRRFEDVDGGGGIHTPYPSGQDHVRNSYPPWKQKLILAKRSFRRLSASLLITSEAKLLCRELKTVKSFYDDNSSHKMSHIGLSVPAWMTDSQVSHLFAAAQCADLKIRDIVHDTAATAASQGVDLCRVSSDYIPCPAQGQHIMTFDLSNNGLVMASHYISQAPYLAQSRRYRVTHRLDNRPNKEPEMVNPMDMINGEMIGSLISNFIRGVTVDKIYLIGPMADDYVLNNGLLMAGLRDKIVRLKSFKPEEVVAAGAARLAKDRMEEQETDCTEPWYCDEVRKEAHEISGPGGHLRRGRDEL